MKIVLLGHSGFVGTNILKAMSAQNITPYCVSRTTGYDLRSREENIRFLKEYSPEVVINCAAEVGSLNYVSKYAADVVFNNAAMITGLYSAISEVDPGIVVIQPIANCAYPAHATLFREEEFWNGQLHPSVLSYGFTRRMLLTVAECYKMQHSVRSINLIVPNMYGPYDSTDPNKAHALNALISKFVKAINGQQDSVEIWGTGVAVREWLYAGDFARIVMHVLNDVSNINYDLPVNIAQESGLSVMELIDVILRHIPYRGNTYYNKNMPDGAPRKVMSRANFDRVFPGFKFTSFDEGIAAAAEYYQNLYPY